MSKHLWIQTKVTFAICSIRVCSSNWSILMENCLFLSYWTMRTLSLNWHILKVSNELSHYIGWIIAIWHEIAIQHISTRFQSIQSAFCSEQILLFVSSLALSLESKVSTTWKRDNERSLVFFLWQFSDFIGMRKFSGGVSDNDNGKFRTLNLELWTRIFFPSEFHLLRPFERPSSEKGSIQSNCLLGFQLLDPLSRSSNDLTRSWPSFGSITRG